MAVEDIRRAIDALVELWDVFSVVVASVAPFIFFSRRQPEPKPEDRELGAFERLWRGYKTLGTQRPPQHTPFLNAGWRRKAWRGFAAKHALELDEQAGRLWGAVGEVLVEITLPTTALGSEVTVTATGKGQLMPVHIRPRKGLDTLRLLTRVPMRGDDDRFEDAFALQSGRSSKLRPWLRKALLAFSTAPKLDVTERAARCRVECGNATGLTSVSRAMKMVARLVTPGGHPYRTLSLTTG